MALPPLREYVSQRKAEIEADIKRLRLELAELKAAEDAAVRIGGDVTVLGGAARRARGAEVRAGSIKDWVLKALRSAPDGALETEGVINAVVLLGGPVITRSSMTPQLSRLKSMGLIALVGRRWTILDGGSDQLVPAPLQPDWSRMFSADEDAPRNELQEASDLIG